MKFKELNGIIKFGALALLMHAAIAQDSQSTLPSVCPSRGRVFSVPYRMSYGMLWNYVQEYENPVVPKEVQHELRRAHVSVAVGIDDAGRPATCGGLMVSKGSNWRMVSVSSMSKESTIQALCSSIRSWKFRRLLVCEKPAAYTGPVDFSVQPDKFELIQVTDPLWIRGPGPMERKQSR